MAWGRPLHAFFGLAFGLGWLVALPLVLSPAGIGVWQVHLPEVWPMLFSCTPLIAALCVQWLTEGNLRICRVGTPPSRVLLGSAMSLLVALLAFAIVPALVLSGGALASLNWSAIPIASAPWWSNPLNLLGGPLNEEPGWRGFGLPRLQGRFGALGASLVLGFLWTLWHLPLFFVKGWLSVPIWVYGSLLICVSILMTWVVNLSGGSVIPAILMHAIFNSSFPILVALCRGVPTIEPGLAWYLAGVVLTTLSLVAATRGRLGGDAAMRAGITGVQGG